jgi:hypothetical protein
VQPGKAMTAKVIGGGLHGSPLSADGWSGMVIRILDRQPFGGGGGVKVTIC